MRPSPTNPRPTRPGPPNPTGPAAAAPRAGAAVHGGPTTVGGLRGLVDEALRTERSLDGLLRSAGRGRTFSAQELLALQSTVFRYSQTVEIISRAADRVVGAVKQAVGTQV